MKKKYVKEVIRIHNEFDYDRVHNVMVLLDWKWASSYTGVPTLVEVKDTGFNLLLEAAEKAIENKSSFVIATGGFRAEAKLFKDDFLWVRQSFVLVDHDNSE